MCGTVQYGMYSKYSMYRSYGMYGMYSMYSRYSVYSMYSMYRSCGRVSTDSSVCSFVGTYVRRYLVPRT